MDNIAHHPRVVSRTTYPPLADNDPTPYIATSSNNATSDTEGLAMLKLIRCTLSPTATPTPRVAPALRVIRCTPRPRFGTRRGPKDFPALASRPVGKEVRHA